ncbi:MAG TPA: FumA C-terminus/TtdB family hydratase beta subunit, partial [Vicinamibacteria bacterium]
TGRTSGDSLGPGTPIMHFEQWMSDDIEVRLLLKGGGCENVSAQYSLPTDLPLLGRADRDLEGVRRCVVHAVHAAQGRGCSAGVLGVAVGGDRASGYELAGRQLFRSLDDAHPEPHIAALERAIVAQANALGIGAMGFGGAVTLLGCKIETANRLPTSFFVTVAYNCWALRRLGIVLDGRTGEIKRWLYRAERPPRMAEDPRLPLTGGEFRLTTPLSEQEVRSLKVGDVVLLNGTLHTGRDILHHYLLSHDAPVRLQGAALYHCGPMASKRGREWTVSAAGPTTSIREEPYEADFLRLFGVRAVIGKGGMGPRTLAALEECGAVYLSAIGGAAQFYADHIEKVEGVHFLEFGVPDAMWHLRVRDFPAIVTMDAHGGSLHERVERSSAAALGQLAVAADA